jgi:hypothetical protein
MRFRLRTLMIVVMPIVGMVAGYLLLPPDNRPMPGLVDTHRWAIICGGAIGLLGGLALRLMSAATTTQA